MSLLRFLIFYAVLRNQAISGDDSSCSQSGGQCARYHFDICVGMFQSGLCNSNKCDPRTCCLETTEEQINEDTWRESDAECHRIGGYCQKNVNSCFGTYLSSSALCGGPDDRQCCSFSVPAPSYYLEQDVPCLNMGGRCVDWMYHKCTAGYERGLCGGFYNRRCCRYCDAACRDSENAFKISNDDESCGQVPGVCQNNTNYCYSGYMGGKCGGPSGRQCCTGNPHPPFVPFTPTPIGVGAFGDIGDLNPSGASLVTAQGDGLTVGGVDASHTISNNDLVYVDIYKPVVFSVATALKIDPAVIAGIISRESRGGRALVNGTGDHGNAFGLMQVDYRYHTPLGEPFSREHIMQATGILIQSIVAVKKKLPAWSQGQHLQGGIAAYNCGVGNIKTWENLDIGTTNDDYSNDVVARAQYFRKQGYN